jgi:hypothetical protein
MNPGGPLSWSQDPAIGQHHESRESNMDTQTLYNPI